MIPCPGGHPSFPLRAKERKKAMLPSELIDTLTAHAVGSGRITVLTGAGISAESGIPTFRGPEGFWTVGSKEYHPQEMATYKMFTAAPDEVWKWYLYRLTICRKADPNSGHLAVAAMETLLGDRFTLITQNVDGLHLRAGNSRRRTFQIHGNVFYMRCARDCVEKIFPVPESLPDFGKGDGLTDAVRTLLRCPFCGGQTRPHVLWFDEAYDEKYYYYLSAQETARKTALLLIAGTSGATNLPSRVAWEVCRQGGTLIDINIEANVFSNMALDSPRGSFIQAPNGTALPAILEVFRSALSKIPGKGAPQSGEF
jgi:NAD-dependent deacetylase